MSAVKNLIISIIPLIILASPSCKKEMLSPTTNSKGEVNYMPPIWKYALHKDGKFHSNSQIDANLVFDSKVLVGTTEGEGDNWLNAVDIETGKELWKWNDIYQPPTEKMHVNYFYEHDGKMGYIVGSRHYCIDLETGQTHWKIKRNSSFSDRITGIGNSYYIIGQPTDTLENYQTGVIFEGDFENGAIRRILMPNIAITNVQNNRLGEVSSVISFVIGMDTMLLVAWQEVFANNLFQSYLGLYNLSHKEWLYEKSVLNDNPIWNGGLLTPITVYEGRAYMSVGYELLCHDVWTGKLIWKHQYNNEIFFSGFVVADGRVIANNENKVLYCYDAATGSLLWTGEGAGTSSRLKDRYLNEIVYFSGGSSGYIHAVDARNGKTVWKLDPAKMGDGADFWKGDIYVVPGKNGGKGKVIALTPMNAYCFEAYR
ncbi:MAG: hypothetical protein EPO28_13065 [Saprospiraceae bacterium]|nr:MAG: hypothetical protein EPO28_13065 [Saprospiraceae bacterium]